MIRAGFLNVYSYGVMLALAFGLAVFLIRKRAPRFGLEGDKMLNMLIIVFISGIIGARAFYILLNLPHYLAMPIEAFDLSKGGLVWYGGFLAGFAAAFIFIGLNKLDAWNVFDLIAPYTALAQAIGRIGCFLNGCCFGVEAPYGYPFGVIFPDSHTFRHPAQIYASLLLLLIFVVLMIWRERRHFRGEIFLGYCVLYSSKRFALEFLRGDNAKVVAGLTISQAISAVVFLIAASIFAARMIKWKKTRSFSR